VYSSKVLYNSCSIPFISPLTLFLLHAIALKLYFYFEDTLHFDEKTKVIIRQNNSCHFSSSVLLLPHSSTSPSSVQDNEEKNMASLVIGKLHFKKM
jgi:hypothetical protein